MAAALDLPTVRDPLPPAHPHVSVLEFLNRINGLLMALAVAAWALIGTDYRDRIIAGEARQEQVVQVLGDLKSSVGLLKAELAIRVEGARDELATQRAKDAELDGRLRVVEQQAVRSDPHSSR